MQIINLIFRPCNKHFEKSLALLRLIYKRYKRGFLQNNGINTKKTKFWWSPWKHADSLLIQHPIFGKQPGFVNIYHTLQEYTHNPVRGRVPLLALGLHVQATMSQTSPSHKRPRGSHTQSRNINKGSDQILGI